jgi:hypothetical protein
LEWIDLTLLDEVNALIANTGVQFMQLRTGDQSGFVVALSRDELDVIGRVTLAPTTPARAAARRLT